MHEPACDVRGGEAMRVLVSVASRHGATAEIARAIADVLAERGLEAAVVPPEDVDACGPPVRESTGCSPAGW